MELAGEICLLGCLARTRFGYRPGTRLASSHEAMECETGWGNLLAGLPGSHSI